MQEAGGGLAEMNEDLIEKSRENGTQKEKKKNGGD